MPKQQQGSTAVAEYLNGEVLVAETSRTKDCLDSNYFPFGRFHFKKQGTIQAGSLTKLNNGSALMIFNINKMTSEPIHRSETNELKT